MERKKLVIGHLFPDLLNLYGDRGNLLVLQTRMEQRGMDVEIKVFLKTDVIDFSEIDILLIGGGSDREQTIACELLKQAQPAFADYVEAGGVVLAVCGGFQMLGRVCCFDGQNVCGLSVFDMETKQSQTRLMGNVVIKTEITGKELLVVGFENHNCCTKLNNVMPFGTVLCGNGNNGEDKSCGAVYKNALGTYLHGPLLPKNPELADYLLEKALQRKYGEFVTLVALDDRAEQAAHDYAIETFLKA